MKAAQGRSALFRRNAAHHEPTDRRHRPEKTIRLEAVSGHITGGDIEDIATTTRDELGIPASTHHARHARHRTCRVAVAPLVRLGADHPRLTGIRYVRATAKSALVMYTPTTAGDRQRFTIAHELGHLKLHRYRHVDDERSREKEEHRFAGAFLYPREVAEVDISKSLSLNGYARIKARWGIAIQALIQRGRDLRLISPDRHRSLMIQVLSRGWRKHEPVEVGIEEPLLLWRVLSSIYGEAPYMAASYDFGIHPERLELWIPVVRQPSAPRATLCRCSEITPVDQTDAWVARDDSQKYPV